MAGLCTREDACNRLQINDWALERLVEMGEISPEAGGRFKTDVVEKLARARDARRAEALAEITALDAPHLGLTP